ncbi:MAG TPA: hypothetical protein VF701_07570 [Thermoanaerobaculia bacterium]
MKKLDLLELPDEARDLLRECEVQGTRSLFEREGRPVAVLISYDEYLAMSETIEIASDSLLFARISGADEDARKGKMLLVEDLIEGQDVE